MTTTRIPRDIDAGTAAAAKEEVIRPLYFVELTFDGPNYLRMNSALTNIRWDNKVWYGAGDIGAISPIRESADMQAHGITLSLSGIEPSMLSASLQENIQGRPAKVWIALLDENCQPKKDPVYMGEWKMDTMSGKLGKTATISLSCESFLARWKSANIQRYTHEEQVRKYPGDLGLEFMDKMPSLEFNWGIEGEEIPYGMWG